MWRQIRSGHRWSIGTFVIVALQLLACAPAAQPSTAPSTAAPSAAATVAQQPAANPGAPGSAKESWQAEWDRTVEAAKQEKLIIVTQPSSLEKDVIGEFQKAFPDIPVEHTGARPSDISPRSSRSSRTVCSPGM
jgi:hypothetical protein